MSKQKLNERETAEAKFTQIEPEDAKGATISEILDHCAEEAREFYDKLEDIVEADLKLPSVESTNHFNPCFKGPTGAGKTSIIRTWARDNGYEVITLNMMGDALDFLGVKTINRDYDLEDDEGNTRKVARVSTIATQAFDPFLRGKTKILFLDEINKTQPAILQSIYDLISFHYIQNGDERMYLPKLLFTVGAMNPAEYGGGRDALDPALKARLQIYDINYDTNGLLLYLIKTFETYVDATTKKLQKLVSQDAEENKDKIEERNKSLVKDLGRLDLANVLKDNQSKIQWSDAQSIADSADDDDAKIFVPRKLESALVNCDGTKDSFLKWVRFECGDEATQLMNDILSKYQDKDHIANQIWGKDYSVKDDESQEAEAPVKLSDEEAAVLDAASDEAKEQAQVNKNLYRKLVDKRKK